MAGKCDESWLGIHCPLLALIIQMPATEEGLQSFKSEEPLSNANISLYPSHASSGVLSKIILKGCYEFSSAYHRFIFYYFFFLGPHLQYMEAPRLGVESELQLQPTPQPQQHQIRVTTATYATACGNAGSLTHRARLRIKPASLWTLCQLLNHWATMGPPHVYIL